MRAVDNPPNPWHGSQVELLGEPPATAVRVYEEEAKSIVSENDSPDIPFRYSINPYRGCFHGCAYCYARPTHEYLDWGAGSDFESRLVVKTNAPERLADELSRSGRLRGERIMFSGVTDAYQPLEASYELTRRCLQVCKRYESPVGVITKGALVERDAELLAEIGRQSHARVYVSIPFFDAELARAIEPFAALPERRLKTIERLTAAGVETGVSVSPVIPGLNDDAIPAVLERARAAGARHAFMILLRLPGSVGAVFEQRLRDVAPLRAERVFSTLSTARGGGSVKDSRFGHRMTGAGPRWQAVRDLFDLHCRKLGYAEGRERFAEPPKPRQGELF